MIYMKKSLEFCFQIIQKSIGLDVNEGQRFSFKYIFQVFLMLAADFVMFSKNQLTSFS